MDFGLIFKLLDSGLSLWASKEKNKYRDRMIQLKQDFYREYNKPIESRSDAVLDNLKFEIKLLSDSFIQAVMESNAAK